MSAISAGWLYVGWGAVNFETNYGLMQQSPSEIKEKLLKALDKEYNVVDMGVVLDIVSVLEKTPITKEALETTRLGKYINELRRKTSNEALAKRAKDLVRRWRHMIMPHAETIPPSNHPHNGSTRIPVLGLTNKTGGANTRGSVISPAMSIPSSNTSPSLCRIEAVPKTHAANKRLRKESSLSPDKTPSKVPRLNGSSFRPDPGECSRDSSDRASDGCEFIGVVKNKIDPFLDSTKKGRRKSSRSHNTLEKHRPISQSMSGDDIVKEKIASIVRTPKVKTTQELVASLRCRSGDVLPAENQANLANCVLPGADELSRNKTEHLAKFLRSHSELQNDNSIDIIKTSREELRPHPDSLPSQSSLGPIHSSNSSSTVAPSPLPEETPERTLEEILLRLPPLDASTIDWEESQSPPISSPEPKVVTEEDVERLHNEHIVGLNGCEDHSGIKGFCEWHEMVSRTSYNGELLHILPYVVID
uniref:Mediator of RNA polymerase II transcription subunit 26 n=2 Tax=Clastoptera arizonana TaxID=38151 RepID=A0A1B6CIZ2_9HEMI